MASPKWDHREDRRQLTQEKLQWCSYVLTLAWQGVAAGQEVEWLLFFGHSNHCCHHHLSFCSSPRIPTSPHPFTGSPTLQRDPVPGQDRWNPHLKNHALAGVAQWIECRTMNQRVTGLIPSQGTCLGSRQGPQLGAFKRQPINVSLPLFVLPFPSKNK